MGTDELRTRLAQLAACLEPDDVRAELLAEIEAAPDAATLDVIGAELAYHGGAALERIADGLQKFGLPGEAARTRTAARLARLPFERYAAQAAKR